MDALMAMKHEITRGDLMPHHYLAMNAGLATETIDGIEAREPAFGLPALWINGNKRDRAELYGYTVVDPASVLATHLTELIKSRLPRVRLRDQHGRGSPVSHLHR
jgi:flagellar biosynthesis protein FlhA